MYLRTLYLLDGDLDRRHRKAECIERYMAENDKPITRRDILELVPCRALDKVR